MRVITVARKPLAEPTVAKNVSVYGTGGINIDGCRIEAGPEYSQNWKPERYKASAMYLGLLQTRPYVQRALAEGRPVKISHPSTLGRYPANVILGSTEAAEDVESQCGLSRMFKQVEVKE